MQIYTSSFIGSIHSEYLYLIQYSVLVCRRKNQVSLSSVIHLSYHIAPLLYQHSIADFGQKRTFFYFALLTMNENDTRIDADGTAHL